MEELVLIKDLAVVMIVSAVIMIICQRFRLPVVLGYILAGVVIGPHTPPFPLITDFHSIHTLSEMGIIFLLFSIGLEFSFSKLLKVGWVSLIAATLEILLMMVMGYGLGRLFGWNFMNSLFLGAILSISSTTIIAKVLLDMKKLEEKFAQVILGILIIEDLLAIVIIAILSGLAVSGELTWSAAGFAMLKVGGFISGLLFLGFLLVPRLLKYLDKGQTPEVMIITVLGLCFASSLIAARFGFSIALGAFLIGAIISETSQGKKIVHQIEPIRDMFTAVFFVSVGMLIRPEILWEFKVPIMVITLVTIIGKVFSCTSATFLAGYPSQVALRVGLGLAQIGEFSFIIARLGESTRVTDHFLYPIAVSVSAITTLTTPMLMKNTGPIVEGMRRIFPKPLGTFLSLYTGWIQKFGSREIRSERRKAVQAGLKQYLPRMVFYFIGGFLFFYGFSKFAPRFEFFQGKIYTLALFAGVFPFLMGALYTFDRIVWDVLTLNWIQAPGRAETESLPVRRALHHLLRFAMGVILIVLFLPFGLRLSASWPILLAAAGTVIFFGLLMWNSMSKIHDRIEAAVLNVFDREQPLQDSQSRLLHDDLIRLIREEYPGEVETQDFLLPFHETAANQTLRDLRLRGETGASVVVIYRGQETLPNPSAETRLMPGDVLLLMGDLGQIKAGVMYLQKKVKEPPAVQIRKDGAPKTSQVQLSSDCAHLGKTLKELKLRRKTGATILGLKRQEKTINNPDGETLLEEGYILILFGWQDEITLAQEYLQQPKPSGENKS